jgi:hypothetical protein
MMMSKYETPNIATLIATSSDSSSASMGKSHPPVSLSLECGRRNEHTVKVDNFDRSDPLSPESEEGMNTETSLESQYGFCMKDKPSAQEDSEDKDSGMDVPPSPNQDNFGINDDLSSESQQSSGTDCVGTPDSLQSQHSFGMNSFVLPEDRSDFRMDDPLPEDCNQQRGPDPWRQDGILGSNAPPQEAHLRTPIDQGEDFNNALIQTHRS